MVDIIKLAMRGDRSISEEDIRMYDSVVFRGLSSKCGGIYFVDEDISGEVYNVPGSGERYTVFKMEDFK